MNIFNDLYPGNLSVMESLISAMETEGVVAFTGAGTSMPELPSWYALIQDLLKNANEAGLIDDSTANALSAEENDLLFVTDEIYKCSGETQTKIRVSEIVKGLRSASASHQAIVASRFKKIITLNYDIGLEMAHASLYSTHLGNITTRNEHEVHDWLGSNNTEVFPPILHWHGFANDADSIVLSGSDYITFYERDAKNKINLRSLFSRDRCVLIGFGFADPFILSQLNSVMQPLPASNKHFAIIGVPSDGSFNCALQRRKYISKYKLEVIFYPIESSPSDREHAALQTVLTLLRERCPRSTTRQSQVLPKSNEAQTGSEEARSYRSSLFEVGGRKIYCEPNLWIESDDSDIALARETKVTVSDLISGSYNCFISAPHEFGLTNLGLRLAGELELSGVPVIFQDANEFPTYKKKILEDARLASIKGVERSTVIIDNFSSIDNRRLLKELITALPNARIIVLRRASAGNDLSEENPPDLKFRKLNLHGLVRPDIRGIVYALSPGWNSDISQTAVNKIYTDLLQLCIPLTPSNVIMYTSVLCRDGSFVPVSRLHIVDRFVSEALQRASDAYSESFNYVNKVDVFSKFCYELFSENESSFDLTAWGMFCTRFKKNNLVEFDHVELIADLASGRIISRSGNRFHFKYRMFFSYFVGRRVASVPNLLAKCLREDRHLELDGLVEVLCGTLPDCSDVLTHISDKFERSLTTFYEKYPLSRLDVHADAKWEITEQEATIWAAISEKIEEGPTGTAELDELKTSLAAERRTEDQKISIIKFIVSENNVSTTAHHLRIAIESAKSARAEVKVASVDAVVRSYALTYEVATVFAPLIATKKFVSWNGFTYVNLIEDDKAGSSEEARERMLSLVLRSLPTSVAKNASDAFGSRKLGQVFLAIDLDQTKSPIYRFVMMSLLLRSKPSGWLDAVKEMVRLMKRDELYLRHYLTMTLTQLKTEVNTSIEVVQLKEFVAAIQLRRARNVKSANRSQISKVIEQLTTADYFSGNQDEKNDSKC